MDYLEFAADLWADSLDATKARRSLMRIAGHLEAARVLSVYFSKDQVVPPYFVERTHGKQVRKEPEPNGLRAIHQNAFERYVKPVGDLLVEGPTPDELRPFVLDGERLDVALDTINSLIQYMLRDKDPDVEPNPPMLYHFHLKRDDRISFPTAFVRPFRRAVRDMVFRLTGVLDGRVQSFIGAEALRYWALHLEVKMQDRQRNLNRLGVNTASPPCDVDYTASPGSHYRALNDWCRQRNSGGAHGSGDNVETDYLLVEDVSASLLAVVEDAGRVGSEHLSELSSRFQGAVISKMAHLALDCTEAELPTTLRRGAALTDLIEREIDPNNRTGLARVLHRSLDYTAAALSTGEAFDDQGNAGDYPQKPEYHHHPRFWYWGARLAYWLENILAPRTLTPSRLRTRLIIWLTPNMRHSEHVKAGELRVALDAAFSLESDNNEDRMSISDTEYSAYWDLVQRLPGAGVGIADFYRYPVIQDYLREHYQYQPVICSVEKSDD